MACDRAQFGEAGQGHPFELRKPLAKPTARRCATCGADVLAHARGEVDDASFMSILNVTDDQTPSVVIAGELALGSFNAALRLAQEDPAVVVVNCAGTKLHDFLPQTRTVMEGFRATQRLLDLEWEDSAEWAERQLDGGVEEASALETLLDALRWAKEQQQQGKMVMVNCAQGRSRSATFAIALVMATRNLEVEGAYALVKEARPFIRPNDGFLKQLHRWQAKLKGLFPAE
ncbi:Tyrosine-protein phosphatase pmp1 [Durusdinium trenchii]|uniref:protein-tyrosine-phosphatase n=1 Tax=Durusdinium trenchii TaxID=1381693 RepID=A0ABP0RC33_9DINO